MNERVSVIVPIYNSEKYLDKCIESIIAQTYSNIEIILVNDGSQDNSLDIMKEYARQSSKIKLLSRENKGQFQTRMDGISLATGQYITFIDADDWIDAQMIENMMKFQNEYNADIIRCSYVDEHIEENRHVINKPAYKDITYVKKQEFKEKVYPVFISTHQINSVWGQLIRREKIGQYQGDEKIRIAEDLMFNLKLYQDIDSIVFIPEPYYHYRTNIEGITNKKDIASLKRKCNNIINVYSQYYSYIKQWKMNDDINRKLVTERIFREVKRCVDELYTFRTSHSEKIEILEYIRENLNANIADLSSNFCYLKTIDKWIIGKKYERLIFFKFFQYKILYDLKKAVKRILVMFNKKGKEER